MPSYPFACPNGHTKDIVLPMNERDSLQQCKCGEYMFREMATGMAVIWQGRWHDQWRDKPGGENDGLGPLAE